MLMRYCGPYAIDDLDQMRFSVSRISSFNDPFELHLKPGVPLSRNKAKRQYDAYKRGGIFLQQIREKYPNITGKKLKAQIARDKAPFVSSIISDQNNIIERQRRRIAEIMDSRARVMCLANVKTDDPMEIPMWGYYADKHCGVRVQLSDGYLRDKNLSLFRIRYPDSPPPLNLGDYPSREAIDKFANEVMWSKSKAWAHEEEVRIMLSQSRWFEEADCNGALRDFTRVKGSDVVRIDLGIRFDETKAQKAINLKLKYPDLKLFKAIKSGNSYCIKYEEIV